MSNFPSQSENKKITVAFIGRGTPKTSPSLASLGTKTEWVGDWFWNYQWYTFLMCSSSVLLKARFCI